MMIQWFGNRPSLLQPGVRTGAVKNSLKLKSLNPRAQISILYRDLRTFGLRESYYRQARLEGVRFFQYGRDQKPEVVMEGEKLKLTVLDQQLRMPVQMEADLLVLNSAIRPSPEGQKLGRPLRFPWIKTVSWKPIRNSRPLDFIKPGFYLCGLAQGPKFAVESMAQARSRLPGHGGFSRKMNLPGMVAQVDKELCRACGECEKACLFEAIRWNKPGKSGRRLWSTKVCAPGAGL
jgi:heterodisulfide reductase subunit A-like polyferredoxin